MNMKQTIGILGGMGPEASAYFYNLLIKQAHSAYGAVQDSDFPPVIVYNLPLEGFDETGIVDELAVKEQLINGVKKLELAGSDFIIIACNTVHLFQAELQSQLSIPLLSIIDVTVAEVVAGNFTKVGVLSSSSTRKYELYKNKLDSLGIEALVTTADQQHDIDKAILGVMAGLKEDDLSESITEIAADLIERGAQAILLGCTELPLAVSSRDIPVPVLNSNEIVVTQALLRTYGG